jgi:hypothetical protein
MPPRGEVQTDTITRENKWLCRGGDFLEEVGFELSCIDF